MQTFAGVSVSELALLLAMKRLEGQEVVPFNFEMIFAEYQKFARSDAGQVRECIWYEHAA